MRGDRPVVQMMKVYSLAVPRISNRGQALSDLFFGPSTRFRLDGALFGARPRVRQRFNGMDQIACWGFPYRLSETRIEQHAGNAFAFPPHSKLAASRSPLNAISRISL